MIRYDFDQHICTDCRAAGRQSRRVVQVGVPGLKPQFMLRCTGCGDEDGPYAGEAAHDGLGAAPLTREVIMSARTTAGGWTRETLASWGVSWPPAKGWIDDLLARPALTPTPKGEQHG